MLVIGDADGADDLAGVMGGERTGVRAETTRMFLEIAIFDPISVATTGANSTFIQMRAIVLNAAWMRQRRRPWPGILHVW